MNLFIHGYDGEIRQGDSLEDPKFRMDDRLQQSDYVLANFPFSADWAKSDLLITRSGTTGIATVWRDYEVPAIPGAFSLPS